MKVFHLPDLGEGLPNAEIHQWHVKEGDEVKVDQLMVSMETAKAVVDVPAPRSGKIIKLHGKPGDLIETGAPLVEFADGDSVAPTKAATVVGNLPSSDTILTEAATGVARGQAAGSTIKALPAVRALAKQLNIDLATVKSTGKDGQITAEDVKHAQSTPTTIQSGYEPLRSVRRAMALAMSQSHAEVVPVTLIDTADIHAWPTGSDITLRIIRALIAACQAEPALNAWYDGKAMARRLQTSVHLGLALDSAEGLFVPVIQHAEQQSAENLRATINRFKEQVKTRTIPAEELSGCTIMLSNFGMFAGRYANPIIVPPCVAILGIGRLHDAVVAVEGAPAVHRVLPLSLTFDHRAATGGEATRFLAAVIRDLSAA